jgi:hypothetical protein
MKQHQMILSGEVLCHIPSIWLVLQQKNYWFPNAFVEFPLLYIVPD